MDLEVFRRKSFGGLDPVDVEEYIEDLKASYEMQMNKESSINIELEKEFLALSNKVNEHKARYEEMENHARAYRQKLREATELLSHKAGEINEIKAKMASKDLLIKKLNIQMGKMEDTLEKIVEKARIMEKKCEKYDEINDQLGDVLIDAKQNARRLTDEARFQAKTIIDRSEKAAQAISGKAKADNNAITTGIADFATTIEELRSTVYDLTSQIQNKVTELDEIAKYSKDLVAKKTAVMSGRPNAPKAPRAPQVNPQVQQKPAQQKKEESENPLYNIAGFTF